MMMDDMTKMVAQKTDLSMDQSKMAVQAMLDYMMAHLPESMTLQMKNIMMGEGKMDDMSKKMGDMGGKMGM